MDKFIFVYSFFCLVSIQLNFVVSEEDGLDLPQLLLSNKYQDGFENRQVDPLPTLSTEDKHNSSRDVQEIQSTLDKDKSDVNGVNNKNQLDVSTVSNESDLPPLFIDFVDSKTNDRPSSLVTSRESKGPYLEATTSQPENAASESENTEEDKTTTSSNKFKGNMHDTEKGTTHQNDPVLNDTYNQQLNQQQPRQNHEVFQPHHEYQAEKQHLSQLDWENQPQGRLQQPVQHQEEAKHSVSLPKLPRVNFSESEGHLSPLVQLNKSPRQFPEWFKKLSQLRKQLLQGQQADEADFYDEEDGADDYDNYADPDVPEESEESYLYEKDSANNDKDEEMDQRPLLDEEDGTDDYDADSDVAEESEKSYLYEKNSTNNVKDDVDQQALLDEEDETDEYNDYDADSDVPEESEKSYLYEKNSTNNAKDEEMDQHSSQSKHHQQTHKKYELQPYHQFPVEDEFMTNRENGADVRDKDDDNNDEEADDISIDENEGEMNESEDTLDTDTGYSYQKNEKYSSHKKDNDSASSDKDDTGDENTVEETAKDDVDSQLGRTDEYGDDSFEEDDKSFSEKMKNVSSSRYKDNVGDSNGLEEAMDGPKVLDDNDVYDEDETDGLTDDKDEMNSFDVDADVPFDDDPSVSLVTTPEPYTRSSQDTELKSVLKDLNKDYTDSDDWFDLEDTDHEEDYEVEDSKEDREDDKEEDETGALGEHDSDDDEYDVTKWTEYDDDKDWDGETDDDDAGDDFDESKNQIADDIAIELAKKKSKQPTAPTSMVLFYTWMIVAVLIVIVGISTYQAHCKGIKFPGTRGSNTKDDRKRLMEHEFV